MKAVLLYRAKYFFILILFSSILQSKVYSQSQDNSDKTLRLGVIGLVHDHVSWVFNRNKEDVTIVGIVETNKEAIARYQKRYQLPDSLFFDSYQALYNKTKPEAVSAFNETKSHLEVVAFFVPKNIPVMVEKPMATSYEDALEIDLQFKNATLISTKGLGHSLKGNYISNEIIKFLCH